MNYNDYFASMNSSEGFKSYFDKIFDSEKLEALYILKGGPGTGKSTLLKNIGKHFEKQGELVERFHCTADIKSLDGIMINNRVAIIDGTSPHVKDPEYPGAVDEIILLSDSLNKEILKNNKDEIIKLTKHKKACYKKAYAFLSAAGKISMEAASITAEAFKFEKMSRSISRYIKQSGIKPSGAYTEKIRQISGITSKGVVFWDSFKDNAGKICCITNPHGCAGIFFEEFLTQLKDIGTEVIISYDSIKSKDVNSLYVPKYKLCVEIYDGKANLYDEKYKVFNMERFIDKKILSDNRAKIRFAQKCITSLTNGAISLLNDASKSHEKLEEIYISAMDFSFVEKIERDLIEKIQSTLHQ